MKKKEAKEGGFVNKLRTVSAVAGAIVSVLFLFFVGLFFIGFISGLFIESPELVSGNVAVVPVNGIITTGDAVMFGEPVANAQRIVGWIEKADRSRNIKAIVLEINSPGGSPVATDEVAQAVRQASKPVVSVIRETGASGAFWVATAADRVFANRMSVVGSIGVYASYLEFSGLLARYNVTYERLVAGNYKDAGSPLKELTPEERVLLQAKINKIHDYFIEAVSRNRNLDVNYVRGLSDGFIMLGSEAKEKGLIDELGGRKEAVQYLEKELNITAEVVEFRERPTLLGALAGMLNENFFQLGRGIGSAITDSARVQRGIVVWS